MDFDTITIFENGIHKQIYPLVIINQNNKKFILYLDTIKKNLNKEDVFIGEITNMNEIIPIADNLLIYFDKILDDLIEKY